MQDGWNPPQLQELKVESLDLGKDREDGGAILEHSGEYGLAAVDVVRHCRKRG